MAYIDIYSHPCFFSYFVLRFKAKYPNFAKQDSKFTVMKHIYLYLIIIVTCILSSCNLGGGKKGVLPKELVQAENIMYENPDSALQILQSMAIPVNKEAHATWSLLLTQAKYKCDVEIWYDQLDEAYGFFHAKHNMQQRALAAYHQGIYYRLHKKEMEKALEFYMEAKEAVEQSSDYNLGHLINIHISFIYVYQKLYKYAEDYCLKAKEYALLSCDDYYISHSFLNLARIYSVQKDYQKSIDYYNKALDIAKQIKNKKNRDLLVSTELTELSNLYAYQQEYDKSLSAIREAMQIDSTKQQLLVVGNLYYKLNQRDSAYYYLEQVVKSDNIYTVKTAYQVLYALSKKAKDYERFVDYSSKLRTVTDSIYKLANNKALIEMQEKYNQQKVINEKNQAERKGLIILCVSILSITVIIVCYQWKVLRQKKELEVKRKELNSFISRLNENKQTIAKNEARIEELEKSKEDSDEQRKSIEEMQRQNDSLGKENKSLQNKIDEFTATMALKSKELEELHALSDKNLYLHKRELFLCAELLKKDEFVNKIKKNPKPLDVIQWRDIMSKADAIYDNYTVRLRTRIPELTENDIRICCLIKLSFCNGDIAKILGISPTSVSRQKLRLKERIIQQVGSLGNNVLLDIWLKEY